MYIYEECLSVPVYTGMHDTHTLYMYVRDLPETPKLRRATENEIAVVNKYTHVYM